MNKHAKLLLIAIVVLVITQSIFFAFMWKYLEELKESPFVVGARRTSEVNNGAEVFCSCQVEGKKEQFYFNTTGLYSGSSPTLFNLENSYPTLQNEK